MVLGDGKNLKSDNYLKIFIPEDSICDKIFFALPYPVL